MKAKHLVRVLDEDPDLGARLDARSVAAARRHAVAEVLTIAPGDWEPPGPEADSGDHLGLLILEGLIARTVTLCGQPGIELFGPGDVVNPWNDDGPLGTLSFEESWVVLHRTDVAVLDHSFHVTVSRWPGVVAELMARGLRQSRWLALNRAVGGHSGLARRLHLLLWLIADRWGRVRSDGIEIPVKLSHDLLGQLVGARRPSVSVAMAALIEAGVVERRGAGRWLLRGEPPQATETGGGRRGTCTVPIGAAPSAASQASGVTSSA